MGSETHDRHEGTKHMNDATIATADSLGTLQQDIGSVIERWVIGGQDEELVAIATIVEAMRTIDGRLTRERVLTYLNARYGDA